MLYAMPKVIMKKSLLDLLLISAIVTTNQATAEEKRSFPAAGIHTLDIDNQSGNVHVEGSQTGKFQIEFNKIEYKNCELITNRSEGRIVITSKSKNKIFGRENCKLDITVKAPIKIDLDIKLGGGDINVSGVKGKFSFKVGSGDIATKETEISYIDLRNGAGNVSISGYIGSGDIKVGAGNIDLSYNKSPAEGLLDLKVGSGQTSIRMPKSAKISSNFKSGTGSLTNELHHSPDAKYKISGTSRSARI